MSAILILCRNEFLPADIVLAREFGSMQQKPIKVPNFRDAMEGDYLGSCVL